MAIESIEREFEIDLSDLDLTAVTATAMRDAVALPETGASSGSSSCDSHSTCGSSSCCSLPA